MGSESSSTGGVASPISAPPVEACTTRCVPARRAASSTQERADYVDVEVRRWIGDRGDDGACCRKVHHGIHPGERGI